MSAIDRRRYEVVPIAIARDGRWYVEPHALTKLPRLTAKLGGLTRGTLAVDLAPYPDGRRLRAGAAAKRRTGSAGMLRQLDVVFPVLHGSFGEDGTIQGLLELAQVPYVGAGILGSAIGMDKDAQKRLLGAAGIPTVRYRALDRADYEADPKSAARDAQELGYPVYVKPNALGSSVGVSRVTSAAGLRRAIDEAFRYDTRVLIEAACEGRELECAVLGNERPEASVVGEVVVGSSHRFYSYESKYIDPSGAAIRIPADLPTSAGQRIRELAAAAFKALDLAGMARVDFLASRDLGELFVNEVNTIPGFTEISMFPKLWEASGLPLPELIDRLIALALERQRSRAALETNYRPRA